MRAFLKSIMPGSGGQGEDAAARYLESRGFRILDRNWRHERLEIDLICRDGDSLVFVEVKTRGRSSFGTAAEALSRDKARRLVRAASHYLSPPAPGTSRAVSTWRPYPKRRMGWRSRFIRTSSTLRTMPSGWSIFRFFLSASDAMRLGGRQGLST